MFKKFKDKLAEEMKQSPARLQASMQQLAQAVTTVSPSLSNSSIQDLSSSRDNFSLTDETEETPKNSPENHGFQTVDLTPPSVNSNASRRSSISSNVSDASFLFPVYESPGNMYHLQSDMDQSASEMDENISPQLDRVSKEQLYTAYRKARTKYDKYRGRYSDLANHYRGIEREKSKLESLLVETQDKALRRISDLKEQCQLEQQAKAHLEDALRNDIEEKDHIINSLRTKIKLLQDKSPNAEGLENAESVNENHNENGQTDVLVDLSNNSEEESEVSLLTTENTQLKEKLQKMDGFLEKYKDMLRKSKEKMLEIGNEKNILERDYDVLQKSSKERLENMEIELNSSRKELERVRQEVGVLRKREEESALSLAENKLSIHRELEGKEEQIKKLQSELKRAHELEKTLEDTIESQKQDLEKMKIMANQKAEESEQHSIAESEALRQKEEMQKKLMALEKEMSSKCNEETNENKELSSKLQLLEKQRDELESETLKLKEEMQRKLVDLEKEMHSKYNEEVDKNKELSSKLALLEKQRSERELEMTEKLSLETKEKDILLKELNERKEKYEAQLSEHKAENENLKRELAELQSDMKKLKSDVETSGDELRANYEKELETLKQALADKDIVCCASDLKIQEYAAAIEQFKQKLQNQDEEIKMLRSKASDDEKISRLQEELENKNTEILGLASELKSRSATINDLKKEMNNLVNHRNSLVKSLKTCKKAIKHLKQDYASLRKDVNSSVSSGQSAIIEGAQELVKVFSLVSQENESIKSQLNEKTSAMEVLENSCREADARLKKLEDEKLALERELKEGRDEIEETRLKIVKLSEFEASNGKLASEIENLKTRTIELEQACKEREDALRVIQGERDVSKKHLLEVQRLEDALDDASRRLAEKEGLGEELSELSAKYRESVELLNAQKSEENKLRDDALEETKRLESELARAKEEIESKSAELRDLQAKIDGATSEREKYERLAEESSRQVSQMSVELENLRSAVEKLSTELQENKDDRKRLSAELKASEEALRRSAEDLERERRDSRAAEERASQSLSSKAEEIEQLEERHSKLTAELEELKASKILLEAIKSERNELSGKLEEALSRCELLGDENKSLKDSQNELIKLNEDLNRAQADSEKKSVELAQERDACLRELESCRATIAELESLLEAKAQESSALERDSALEELESKNAQLLDEIDELSALKLSAEEKLQSTAAEWKSSLAEKEALLSELLAKCSRLEEEAAATKNRMASGDEELKKSVESLRQEKMKLESQLDETLVTFQAKESQMQAFNDELRNQILKLREQSKTNEDEQNLRLKQVSRELHAQLQDKEKELHAALEKRFDHMQNYETDTIQEYREQLKDFQVELTKKSQQIESLIAENERAKRESKEEVEKLSATINQIKSQHIEEMQEIDRKWKGFVHQKTNNLESKHEQEIAELTNEWQNERKNDESNEVSEELENTTRVAMATVQSNTGSFHTLQQTLLSQKRELAELRKLVKMRQEEVEDSTEIEYLRNILFKYMMGKETMTLAKVIAAVVKFDQDQTSKIMKREEDKQSLLGSLGLT